MDLIGQIRRAFFDEHRAIKEICRDFRVSRGTVRKVVRSGETEFKYARDVQPSPKLGEWVVALTLILEAERGVTAHPASLSRFLIVQGFTVKKNAAGVRSRSR